MDTSKTNFAHCNWKIWKLLNLIELIYNGISSETLKWMELLSAKLSKIMLAILTIPHNNAECEKIFSVVN